MSTELTLWIKKILILVAIILTGYILYVIESLLLILLISGFITILVTPLVNLGEKKHIHASITLIGVYLILLVIAMVVVSTIIPIIITYLSETVNAVLLWSNNAQSIYALQGIRGFGFNTYIEQFILFLFNENNIDQTLLFIRDNAGNIQSIITKQLSSLTSGGFSILSSVGNVFLNWILIGVMTFLMVLERREIGHFILDVMPDNIESYLMVHYREIQQTLNAWIKAMLILSLSIFFVTYIGLTLVELIFNFDTHQTFTLALISGIMEFIPYVGPILSLIPALIIGLGISWKVAFIITILYIIIQQTENNILVPYIMSRSLNLSPFLIFVVMIIGASLGGILGIILAVPAAAISHVIYANYRATKLHKHTIPAIPKVKTTTIKKI